ncbi:flagellar biosynthetic protein FliR [Desulfofundulus australicus DSM 11792]|uniref:Flagellar biosynthetic protein FliR n=1 Tax=Desulfofundulus australicus DSM 11792 TaxID=1121425 RepID=A0A1M4VJT0_9FIRM|nr:flagellar biosynthetic protein FliR [Desulfofundulus australicus]SHE69107.1 flagellar biosynthetic protein FliR [Desulfofundulus australicus DSM 11792]
MLNYGAAATFILIFIRASAFLVAGPLFFFLNVPRSLKAFTALVLAVVLYPLVPGVEPDFPGGLVGFALAAAEEAGVGLVLGFVAGLVFQSLAVAGQIMDIQMGFFMASFFDPAMGHQSTLSSRFLYLLGMVLFFILDGHHVLIAALARSYELVPLAGASLDGVTTLAVVRIFARMVALGVQIAAPVVAVVLIIDLCLGLLGRTAPEMNIFMLGFPLKIALGILTLSIMVPLFGVVFRALVRMMEQDLYTVIRGLSG